ncbi:Fanconi anaemia protein FANCD2 [Radiomyces spectabilis]|uniref:Fanconi anaemia protein FANCD2 n=1 Tax=Radiomyces spectabilis TaxID=64574 RepID=UPI0022211A69|nr:Fanconi anaemia protein FANCD2 [Radiomyces spectabilis]KAI8384781.1 Fanconi anaemia protein FANCD2 [Radiomyces spectabilis]
MVYLLERLPEFQDELENDHSSSCTARLILHQLRWLDFIVEPQILTEKLIEPMVVYLKELMHENGDLTVPILDALSNLTLHSESLDDVRQTVLERLESAELDDLAVIVKFLLQTATPHTIDEVIYGIRHNLDFYSLGKLKQNEFQSLTSTTTIRSRKSDANAQAPEALILESIKLGLQFHKFVCDSWIKSITALEDPGAHKIIDVLVLFILHSMTSMKKKAEQIFRKKIINRAITAQLIQLTLTNHGDALTGYWNTILSLSDSVLRSSRQNHAIVPCSSTLYVHSFIASNAHYQLEIIGSLVTHIGSGEISFLKNVALNVLLQLVKFDVERVSEYAVFIKGILDYLDNLSLGQIRVLFDIFSIMALTVRQFVWFTLKKNLE